MHLDLHRPCIPGLNQKNLTTVLVNNSTRILDTSFKDTIGGGISNHGCSETSGMQFSISFQIIQVQVTIIETFNGNNLNQTKKTLKPAIAAEAGLVP